MRLPNVQPIQKQDLRSDGMYSVHSIFKTIQGEGPFAGDRAIFIRLAGCNLQCPLCDTDYTSENNRLHFTSILEEVNLLSANLHKYLIVISGGEPFRQNLRALVGQLLFQGYLVQIETNGSLFVDLWWDLEEAEGDHLTIVCSPKTGKLNEELIPKIDVFKYVLDHRTISNQDGLPLNALKHSASPWVARPPDYYEGIIYVNPADAEEPELTQKNIQATVKSAMTYGYRLGLQLHKLIGVP